MEDNLSDNENMLQTQVDEETNVNDSDDNEVYNDISEGGWIQWFCQLEGNEFFAEIDEEFIRNRWNIYGINKLVKNYKYNFSNNLIRILLELILSPDAPSEEILTEE
jgi:hypothetical protein